MTPRFPWPMMLHPIPICDQTMIVKYSYCLMAHSLVHVSPSCHVSSPVHTCKPLPCKSIPAFFLSPMMWNRLLLMFLWYLYSYSDGWMLFLGQAPFTPYWDRNKSLVSFLSCSSTCSYLLFHSVLGASHSLRAIVPMTCDSHPCILCNMK